MYIIFFLSGCATFKANSYQLQKSLNPLLPPLKVVVPGDTLFEYFRSWDSGGSSHTYYQKVVVGGGTAAMEHIISRGFCEILGPDCYGYARIEVLRDKRSLNALWFVGFVATLTASGFLGIPYISHSAEIEIEFQILDARQNLVKKYRAIGKGTAYGALYWGYMKGQSGSIFKKDGGMDVTKAAIAKACKEALEKIRNSIQQEVTLISNRLLEQGTLTKVIEAYNNQRGITLKEYRQGTLTEKEFRADNWNTSDPLYGKIGIIAYSRENNKIQYVLGIQKADNEDVIIEKFLDFVDRGQNVTYQFVPAPEEICRLIFQDGVLESIIWK